MPFMYPSSQTVLNCSRLELHEQVDKDMRLRIWTELDYWWDWDICSRFVMNGTYIKSLKIVVYVLCYIAHDSHPHLQSCAYLK
jgi:hypothetical protein